VIKPAKIELPYKYEDIYEKLIQKGLSKRASVSKANMLLGCIKKLVEAGIKEKDEIVLLYVPGRVEILGKHTDYAGGRSITAAVERGFVFAASPRSDSKVNVYDISRVRKTSFKLEKGLIPEEGHWTNYLVKVARRLIFNFGSELNGADIAFASDLPSTSGLSSSSVLVTGFFLSFAHVSGIFKKYNFISNIKDTFNLASYISAIENGFDFGTLYGEKGAGNFGSSQDQIAFLCSNKGFFSQYSYCPVKLERQIPLPEGYVLGIATSGMKAQKKVNAKEKYNSLIMQASVLVNIWNNQHGTAFSTLNELVSQAGAELVKLTLPAMIESSRKKAGFKTAQLMKRFEHFIKESNEIVPLAGEALLKGDIDSFARLSDESERISGTYFDNSTSEAQFLCRIAKELGAPAACSFSGGFGGSVWALVPVEAAIEGFFFEWANEYRKAFAAASKYAEFISTWLGPASFRIEPD
jgi:galactokinase